MLNRTQEQVMQSWTRSGSCVVSIVCATYNHEQYIREAIDSFLIQETDFPFEIIIHDDASTDNTPNIIKEYYLQYPDIIRPIYQKENQYSKGGFKPSVHAASYSRGKYIALCEGDDYWINKQKLQIQVEAMERHPEVDFSFHSAYCVRNGVCDKKPSWGYGRDSIFKLDAIIGYVGKFAPTSSYIIRREVLEKLPEWFYSIAPVGDVFIEIYGASRGGALYINKPMAVYRVDAVNAWSSDKRFDSKSYLDHWASMLESYLLLKKEFVDYSEIINRMMAIALCNISAYYLLTGENNKFRSFIKESISCYYSISLKQRALYWGLFFPKTLRILFKLHVLRINRRKRRFLITGECIEKMSDEAGGDSRKGK